MAMVDVSTGDYQFGGMDFLMKLQDGCFPGRVYPIKLKVKEIRGLNTYPNLSPLPEVPDLSMVCETVEFVLSIIEKHR